MKRHLLFPLFACVVAIGPSACADRTPTALRASQLEVALDAELPPAGARGVTVMTRNLMFGGSLTGLVTSTDPIPVRWATFWADIQAANFPERAGEFAREIAVTSPALVGLQEVPLLRIQDPSDAIIGGTTPATTVLMDFLAILQDSLVGRGLSYNVAIARVNTDVELPMLVAGTTSQYVDMRYADRDVILARTDVAIEHPLGSTYSARVSAPLNDGTLSFTARSQRGWASIEALVGGVRYRFVTTHLERASGGGLTLVSEAQATELIAALQAETLPVILVCDCNSRADGTGSRSYGWLVATAADGGGGFLDAWSEAHPGDPGYTARLPGPTERLDLILIRQRFGGAAAAGIVGGVHVAIVGEQVTDKTPSGLWASDHAGVVATFQLPRAVGVR